jgi:hypothetical protein
MKKYLLLSVLLISFYCRQSNNEQERWRKIQEKEVSAVLEGKILKRNQSIIWSRWINFLLDDSTIMTTCYICRDTVYQMYRIKNDEVTDYFKFGKYGNGPEELFDIAICKNDSGELYIYETLSSQIRAFNVSISAKDSVIYTPIHFTKKNSRSLYNEILPFGKNRFIALGGNTDKPELLTLFYLELDSIIELHIPLIYKNNEASERTKNSAARKGDILKRVNNKQILYYGNWGRYAEIISFDADDNLQKRTVLASDAPIFEDSAMKGNPEYSNDTYMGMKGAVTETRIYLMPEPYTKREFLGNKDYKGYPNTYADKLYIFDWEGNFITSYQLNIPIERLAVYSDDTGLIGSTVDMETGEYEFVKYILPK